MFTYNCIIFFFFTILKLFYLFCFLSAQITGFFNIFVVLSLSYEKKIYTMYIFSVGKKKEMLTL
ncbi:hypothetical protein HANVADRAFT_80628 [Hanseniaspora valbyensis NRRL Y-1626]|uniref:Uncharacterized protein n=1 Tax=Hanseniaspora valbyensis NRRL Y-1626 TaxID=766949 RepID=A0A1B7TCI6_9ASCO|nr:hypothetical protein HANVADRAFT_80628 [Hanseniaspora valbyensis NRRL Y-1626]